MKSSLFSDLRIRFGSQKRYDDMMITIKAYQSLVPPEARKPLDNFIDIYEEALKYVGPKSYDVETREIDPLFKELTTTDGVIAVAIGFLAYYVSFQVDEHGLDIEEAINKALPKNYDVNNPFDVKQGYGHRIFGHDIAAMGVKNIPVDYIIHTSAGPNKHRAAYSIGQFIGVKPGQKYVSMWDLVWKFYGNDDEVLHAIFNCFKHTIVHFSKDLFTPAGLPLPFTSLLNEYSHEFSDGRISEKYYSLRYKNSFAQKLSENTFNLRASDLASLVVIESFVDIYVKSLNLQEKKKDYKRLIKVIAMATCIITNFSKLIYLDDIQLTNSRKIVSGARINLLMTGTLTKNLIQEMIVVMNASRSIKKGYRNWGEQQR